MPEHSEESLARLERQVAAQQAALGRVPLTMSLPADVIALLATPPALDVRELPRGQEARVTSLISKLAEIQAQLAERQRLLAGRAATVRAARRAGPAAHVIDYRG